MPDLKVPTQILLSLTTAPLLLGLLGARAMADLIKTASQASEEIFRGDRLPVLKSIPSEQTDADSLGSPGSEV